MRSLQLATLIAAVVFTTAAYSRGKAAVVSLKRVKAPPAYETIAFATAGPAHSFAAGNVRGTYQRIVILEAEVAYDRPSLRLETLTYGDESCCRRLVSTYVLDLNELLDMDIQLPDAATTELKFLRWASPLKAEFRYGNLVCSLQDVGKPRVTFACRSDG